MEDNTAAVAAIGAEMRRILDSEAYQTGLTLTRARIFSEWTNTVSVIDRESLHSELCALERLQESFRTLDNEGFVARETIRRVHGEDVEL